MSHADYREFYYPLNVFMHVLTHEEGDVRYLHYGLFESADEPIGVAQERSTAMLLARLPSAPARLLEVGIGLATTLGKLTRAGYEAEGITPDNKQIAMARARHGDSVRVHCSGLESFQPARGYDCVIFQESAQYIDSGALWSKLRELTGHVIVLDEFAIRPNESTGSLHSLDRFLTSAALNGFHKTEEVDLSERAAPTVAYFMDRLPRYRERLIADIGITAEQIDELIESGHTYQELYENGIYGYRLLQFRRASTERV